MDYTAALDQLYSLASRGVRLGLERIRVAAGRLGNPQLAYRSVQIAGTNGKGTVAYLVARAFEEAGIDVGLYTSPHLHRFAERIRINGKECDSELIGRHLRQVLAVDQADPTLSLTFFEVATLTAFCVFAERGIDVAVCEVGLGGRLDATSICDPFACAITSVGLDHTDKLGNSLTQIAKEKAAIARRDVPLICGRLADEARLAVEEVALKCGAPLYVLGKNLDVLADLLPPWPGAHQRENAAVASAIFQLGVSLDDERAHALFQRALTHAQWPGRYEIISGQPQWILDGAHNEEAISALVKALGQVQVLPQIVLFGAMADKPVARMLERLRPCVGRLVLAPPPLSRAFDPGSFAATGDQLVDSVDQGLKICRELATPDAVILVTGSFFTVAEARRILLGETADPQIRL